MPYNPNSAYPRKTTYIPPTYGDHSFKRAVNGQDFSSQNTFGSGPYRPRGGEIYSDIRQQAATAHVHPGAAAGLEAAARHPILNKLSPIGERGIATAVQATGNVAVPAITGNVGPLVARGAGAVAQRGVRAYNNLRGGPIHGPTRPAMTHGNPAAVQTRNAASSLSDELVTSVLTGKMPGPTGQANISPKLILPSKNRK